MKIRLQAILALFAGVSIVAPSSADAGWGHLGGSSGGSSGYSSAYASSGGSSGYSARYSSSGGSSGYSAYSSSGGSSGYYTASYSSYGSSGSSGRPGILHRVASHIHDHLAAKRARHVARRTARYSSYGSSGGYNSSGGYSSFYGSSSGGSSGYSSYYGSSGSSVNYGSSGSTMSYGSSGSTMSYGSTGSSSYGSTGTSYGSVGAGYYGASYNSSNVIGSVVSDVDTRADSVYLTVAVPSSAKVFVNGKETTSTGTVRQFVSRGLVAGKSYQFDIRAEVLGATGEVLTETKEAIVTAGARQQLQFAFSEANTTIETAVTVNVPEGAQITLAGNKTQATGEQRTFRTSQLKPGQTWDQYEIEVEHEGKVKRQLVRLIAGDNLELSFNFDGESESQRIASR